MKRQETLRRRVGKNTTIAGIILSLACGCASQAQIAAVQAHRDALRQGITPDEQKIHAQVDAELARVEGRPDPSRSQLAVCSPGSGGDQVRDEQQAPRAANTLELVRFDFRGCRLGDVVNEEALLGQGYKCFPLAPYDQHCWKSQDKIGEIVVSPSYFMIDGRLAMLIINFPSPAYQSIVDAFAAKFGPPHERKQEEGQNRMGATFVNEKSIWQTTTGRLEISRFSSRITSGDVTIYDPILQAIAVKRDKIKADQAARDL